MAAVERRLLVAFLLSLLVAGLAYRQRALTRGGAAGAVLVGTIVLGMGGWVWGCLLVAFFASSSLLTSYRKGEKYAGAGQRRGDSRRHLNQTLANGGLPALIALLAGIIGHNSRIVPVLAFAFYGALATANADTWATELGTLSRRQPRLITSGQEVPPGTSGGVTLDGLLAAQAGALFIGIAAFVLNLVMAPTTSQPCPEAAWMVIPASALSGLVGCLADSAMGARLQVRYWCDACACETEHSPHACGFPARPIRGWAWMDNDMVNFISSAAGALLGAGLGLLGAC